MKVRTITLFEGYLLTMLLVKRWCRPYKYLNRLSLSLTRRRDHEYVILNEEFAKNIRGVN